VLSSCVGVFLSTIQKRKAAPDQGGIFDKGHSKCHVPYRYQDDDAELRAVPSQECQTAKTSDEKE
jgi:hypothetical protein